MPGKKRPIPSASSSERASNYFDVLLTLNASWRVIVTRCGLSWALQRRAPSKPAASIPTRRKRHSDMLPDDQAWFGVAYCASSEDLIRAVFAHAGECDPIALAVVLALPPTPSSAPDPFDQLRPELAHHHNPGRPRKPRRKAVESAESDPAIEAPQTETDRWTVRFRARSKAIQQEQVDA